MTEQQAAQQTKAVLVVGGGIGGLTVAVETAEAGWPVVVVEKNAFVGGRVAANHLYFPKMCPPTCGLEINFQRLRKNPAIRIHTLAEVTKVSGGAKDAVATDHRQAALREREVHRLRQVRRGLPGRAAERLQRRPRHHQGRLPAPRDGLPAALRHRPRGLPRRSPAASAPRPAPTARSTST